MKRVLPFLLMFVLVPVFLIVPVLGAELSGGYYLTGDSALGKGLTFYIPSDYAEGCLTYDSSGNLFNISQSTIYLYCVEYPDYTISASRFSGFQYRQSSGGGYTSQDLNLKNIADTNVQIFDDHPLTALSTSSLLIMIAAVLVVGVGAFVILRR